ncbi:putative metallophosphoesterase [Sphingomonas jeddahensis]|uniref:Putative metallophosphoesterase n=2 Tax=Sphingomonas jeddahensis TaxID=1915074 RepID=A0A1V2ET13_9SPHN|nr:putative metallophosphoesterase [Sphingomonas jeddahensis]
MRSGYRGPMRSMFRFIGWFLLVGCCVGGALLGFAWREAHRDPIVRRATIALPDWPAGKPPVTVALASDIHVGGGAMDAARLRRMAARIAATRADLVVLAGDFIDGHEPRTARANAPVLTAALKHLRPPLGTIAVLGNHDNDSDPRAVAAALAAAGISVIENDAVTRGPLAVGVVGDSYSRHDDLPATLRAMRSVPGARLVVTHSPDIAPTLPDDTPLLLAGHTHCGQVVFPLVGALWIPSGLGERYRCGLIRDGTRTVVVGAGLGTSMLPIRLGAPPDLWLLTLGPR